MNDLSNPSKVASTLLQHKTHSFEQGAVHYWTNAKGATSSLTLVFLPGLTADHRLFDKQIEYFAGELEMNCFVWDTPSHGLSRPFPLTWSMADLASMLHEILGAEQIERPVFVGQSLGGYITQAYLELFPGEVTGFVSVDSSPLKREYYRSWELWSLKHTHAMYTSIPWKMLLKLGSEGCATSNYGITLMRTMMADYDKRYYVDLAAHGFYVLAEAVEADKPYEIDCPALLLCGTKDAAGMTKRYNSEWTKSSGLPLIWIEGAGHNSNTDAPQVVNEHIKRFVDGL